MGMTMAQKILANHSGKDYVAVGEYVTAKVDQVVIHDSFIDIDDDMREKGFPNGLEKIWDKERVVVLIDHGCPAMDKNVKQAENHVKYRALVKKLGLPNFYDVKAGICHQVMCDKGFALPGSLTLGADSHATLYGGMGAAGTGIGESEMAWVLHTGELWFMVPPTIRIEVTGALPAGVTAKDIFLYVSGNYGTEVAQYKAIEWCGETVDNLSLASRLCIANQSVELGAKFAFFPCDEKTEAFLKGRNVRDYEPVYPDPDAEYERVIRVDASALEPLVAPPHGMQKTNPVGQYKEIAINQCNIGGCANGRFEDLEIAARILKDRKVHPSVRLIVGAASYEVYKAACQAGLMDIFCDAGAIISHPHCGPCTGVMGTLAPGEVAITATSRNFKGRFGSPGASIYLASPATVAASAVTGYITDPRTLL